MELNNLYTLDAHEKGAEMQVIDKHGDLADCYIMLIGFDSRQWEELINRHSEALQSELHSNAAKAEMLAGAALGWRGFMSDNVEIDFSIEKVKELFINAPYICDQANKFIAKRANFTKG